MSSLKAIMDDVDVEPLSSQTYNKSTQAPNLSVAPSSEIPSQASQEASVGKSHIKRRRSNRVQSTATSSDTRARYSNATGEDMDFSSVYQPGPSSQATSSELPESSRGSGTTAEMPVKYTPVTGRISRAKKGVPVHTCDICRPVKTFTRAEHLRRHQLSHQKPAYPCTFEDCERAFHRPDLLARHIHRHETQGEKAYKAGDPRSRASSSASESRTPSLKVEGSTQGFSSNTEHIFPSAPMTPRTSGVADPSSIVSNFSTSGADFSTSNLPSRSAPSSSPGLPRVSENYSGMTDQQRYGPAQSSFSESFAERGSSQFPAESVTPQLPLLKIPEESWVPGLSYNSSPWCSSASDTQSDASRNGSQWAFRGRSASVATLADWPVPAWMDIQPFESLDLPTFGGLLMQSVGTPALSAHNRFLAQNFPAPTARMNNRFEFTRAKKNSLEPTLQQYPETDLYFASYWQFFHPLLPILHKPTFDPTNNQLLSSAMVAIGTQYHNSPEARKRGSELSDLCKKEINACFDWSDLSTLQAILLTEIFTRFRGRKIAVHLSRSFSSMYGKLLDDSNDLDEGPEASIADTQLEQRHRTETWTPSDRTQLEWHQWIEKEARRRLLSACFMFDVHQSMSHHMARAFGDVVKERISLPCPEKTWEASSSLQWKVQRVAATQPLCDVVVQREFGVTLYSQSLLICAALPPCGDMADLDSFTLQTPNSALERFMNLFPNALLAHSYLALYHTPLHDLLAVAGDTWVFSKKVTPPSAFHTSQARLKAWSASRAAAQATYHACHVLSIALFDPPEPTSEGTGDLDFCLSGYWSIYVSTLIIWAFGHRIAKSNRVLESGMSDQGSALPTKSTSPKEYIEVMLSLEVEDFLTSKATVKGDTTSVIETARQRLESENIGCCSGLLVDAILVLGKIKEAGKGRWF